MVFQDVLLGRGSIISQHHGNLQFRLKAKPQKQAFAQAIRKDKRAIAMGIIHEIQSLDPPGRFLMEPTTPTTAASNENKGSGGNPCNNNDGVDPAILSKIWVIVDHEKVMKKVLHRLREKEVGTGEDSDGKVQQKVKQTDRIVEKRGNRKKPGRSNSSKQGGLPNSTGVSYEQAKEKELDGKPNPIQRKPNPPQPSPSTSMGDCVVQNVAEDEFSLQSLDDTMDQVLDLDYTNDFDLVFDNDHVQGGNGAWDDVFEQDHNGNGETTKHESVISNSDMALPEKSLNVNEDGLDKDVDQFLNGFSSQHDHNINTNMLETQPKYMSEYSSSYGDERALESRELTLCQWIERSRQKKNPHLSQYINGALPIASKLTGFLTEADKDTQESGHTNPIPLQSITAGNGLIRVSSLGTVEHAWFMSRIGDDIDSGNAMSRVYAFGTVLYQLFTGEEPPLEENATSADSMGILNLSGDRQLNQPRPAKKSHGHSEDQITQCMLRLEAAGIPWSLCTLVKNLLDCSNGDFCGDDAYTSFTDLQLDLQLMINEPSRFLDNISMSPVPSLSICDKLYGRDEHITKLEEYYKQCINNRQSDGVIICGGSGVGKSKLALHVKHLTDQSDGIFCMGKFDQNKESRPMATVGNVFNQLCDSFVRNAIPVQLKLAEKALKNALGNQAGLLAEVVPGLAILMPSRSISPSLGGNCVNAALSMRFLFGELLNILASHYASPISLLLDDTQWSDDASLMIMSYLISCMKDSKKSVFFIICHRDDEVGKNPAFETWLNAVAMLALNKIQLENLTINDINSLFSDSLHLSPRITRPLASVLYHKTRGNPLFARKMLESLRAQNYIYLNLNPLRWAWDLNKISELEISEDVVALLIKDIGRLPSDLQFALKVASCIGSSVKVLILDILSADLGMDLTDLLQQVSEQGFMTNKNTMFVFSHDKIEQASFQLMPEQQRQENHMRFGLALCSYTLSNNSEDDELFFTAINQVNKGGPGAVHEPSQKKIIAQLNLQAGKRAMDLADNNKAYQLFNHGKLFLACDHWTTAYKLSIDLYNSAAESACVIDNREAVKYYSTQVAIHAKCFEDKFTGKSNARIRKFAGVLFLTCLIHLNPANPGLYAYVNATRQAELLKESMEDSFKILAEAGEDMPVALGDGDSMNGIRNMCDMLRNETDDAILNMKYTTDERTIILQKVYVNLAQLLHFVKPSLIGSVSLKMVNATMKSGLTSMSPLAFTYFGETLISLGNFSEGCRLGMS